MILRQLCACLRTPKRGGPRLTVEIEANGDTWSTYERGPSWVGLWARRAGKRNFLTCLGSSKNPVQNIIFFTIHFFNLLVPIAQPGSRAGSPVSVSVDDTLPSLAAVLDELDLPLNIT